jgi:hypothetical protein
MKTQKFPPGWDEKRVKALIAHYESQTEDEGMDTSLDPRLSKDFRRRVGRV